MNSSSCESRALRHHQEQKWLDEYEGKFSEAFSGLLTFVGQATQSMPHFGKSGVTEKDLQDEGCCCNPVHAIWKYEVILEEACTDISSSMLQTLPKPILTLESANLGANIHSQVSTGNFKRGGASMGFLGMISVALAISITYFWGHHFTTTSLCYPRLRLETESIPQNSLDCFSSNNFDVRSADQITSSLQSTSIFNYEQESSMGTKCKTKPILRDRKGRFCKRHPNSNELLRFQTSVAEKCRNFHLSNDKESFSQGLHPARCQGMSGDIIAGSKTLSCFVAEFCEGPEE